MRRQRIAGVFDHRRILGKARHEREFASADKAREIDCAGIEHIRLPGQPLVDRLREHRADPGMGILHIVDRVLVGAREREVDIEHELGIGLALDQKKTHRVAPAPDRLIAADALGRRAIGADAARPVDQIAQGDVRPGALGDLDLLATAHHGHHLVQHVVGKVFRDADA